MNKAVLALVLVLVCAMGARADEGEPKDALAEALKAMGITESDLGYRPKAHWPRYPHPKTVPYVMPFFEDLLSHPLDTYAFTRTLGNAVEDFLTPALLREAPKKGGKESLYKLGVMLATERRIGGFRVFGIDTAHLDSKLDKERPLGAALEHLFKASKTDLLNPIVPTDVPRELRPALGQLVLDLVDARTWIDRGLRRVSREQRKEVFAALPELVSSTPDGTKYFPVIDDVARLIDEHSLHYGCLKALQAVQNARRAIGGLARPKEGWPEFQFGVETRWGNVVITNNDARGGADDRHPLLFVQFARGASRGGPVGATSVQRPLSVALLLDVAGRVGTDYDGSQRWRGVRRARHDIAAGVLGCGIVYTAGEQDNEYRTEHWGLGAGLFGLGALIDEGGDDVYRMGSVGQGAAFFGAGLLLDAAGDDVYALREGDGQGFGGPGGIGILADRSGDDRYYAEPDAKKAGRADYHSKNKIAVSNAQGVGSGRRGDISDGHVWAGGLGALIDVDGNDIYEAGNFSQGLGYWYGTGLLWDGGGNDSYRSVYFTQGSGAHFAIGALIDEGGNDRHVLWETAGAAFAFGWDVVNAFLIDRGNGNDVYVAERISLGVAEVRSNAFFIDEGGDDQYHVKKNGKLLGDIDKRKSYDHPGRTADFPWRLAQVGVFLDLGGTDRYMAKGKDGYAAHLEAADGKTWHVIPRDPKSSGAPNVSYAADLENAVLKFLAPWPPRRAK